MKKTWHIIREGHSLILSRHPVPQFDLSATASFPLLRRLPLAQMIRQDMWRALQRIRGFSPVVQVVRAASGLTVTAGGRVHGPFPKAQSEARLHTLLSDPSNRARWHHCAQLTQGTDVL